MSNRAEVLKNIKECENRGEFDKHVDPIDYSIVIPVDSNFHYILKGFKEKFVNTMRRWFKVKPATFYQNAFKLKTKVHGKRNLKGVKSAIVTCNHVHMFDCLAVMRAAKGHKLHFTVADFNNQRGKLGDIMRAGGIMPFSSDFTAMKNFTHAVSYYLAHNQYVVFYPEQAMWWQYEKPRPLKIGAYRFAVKNKVPIVPMFITFRPSGKYNEEGIELKYFDIHVLKPIYADKTLPDKEAMEKLRDQNYEAWKQLYESHYNRPLTYDIAENAVASADKESNK